MSRRPALPIGLRLRWLALLTAGLTACGGGGGGGSTPPAPGPGPAPPPPPAGPLVVETVASGLDHPWGLAFLPDGRFLVTERAGGGRTGQMSLIGSNGSRTEVSGLPPARFVGQGGLLDVALDPDHASNRRVYWSYSESGTGGDGLAVARGVFDAATASMSGVQVILRQLPKLSGENHYGGRIAFGADQRLFVAMGERQQNSRAQNLGESHGKVARIERDGSIPADNPFVGTAGARTEIWSRGHRNPQGAAIHPVTGALWVTEHGPQGGDELNIVQRGLNYGWPLISHGCEYGATPGSCTPVGGATSGPGLEQPLAIWGPLGVGTTAPGGLAFYTADRFPEWRGKLLVAALAGRTLWRLDIDQPGNIVCTPTGGQSRSNCSEVAEVANLDRRIRDVRQGPDGWVYLLTDDGGGNDAMLRIRR